MRQSWFATGLLFLALAPLLAGDADRPVSKWIQQLGERNVPRMKAARAALLAFGDQAVPELLAAAGGTDSLEVRCGCLWVLRDIVPRDPKAMEGVLALTSDSEPRIRATAIGVLDRLDPVPDSVLAALTKSLDDPDVYVRLSAANAAACIGPAAKSVLPKLKALLASADEEGRPTLRLAIRFVDRERFDPVGAYLELDKEITEGIQSGNHSAEGFDEQFRAMMLLGSMDRRIVPDLVRIIQESAPSRRALLMGVLKQMGPEAAEAAPFLAQLVKDHGDGDHHCLLVALEALGEIGPGSPEVLQVLIDALKGEGTIPRAAVEALAGWGSAAAPAVPALVEALEGQYGREAAEALGQIGPQAASAVPALRKAIGGKDEGVAGACATALGGIGPEAEGALEALIEALGREGTFVRPCAASALARFGPRAAPAVPALCAALQPADVASCRAVVEALAAIGPAPAEVVPALEEALAEAKEIGAKAPAERVRRIEGEEYRMPSPYPALIKLIEETIAKLRAPR